MSIFKTNDGYIKACEWIKCTIDGITYECYFEYGCNSLLSKPWVTVTVRKYVTKKWWFLKWKYEEFEAIGYSDLETHQCKLINESFYFKAEYIKDWVKRALKSRENEILEKRLEIEKEKRIKILKEIS
jgi:hypothetical protein